MYQDLVTYSIVYWRNGRVSTTKKYHCFDSIQAEKKEILQSKYKQMINEDSIKEEKKNKRNVRNPNRLSSTTDVSESSSRYLHQPELIASRDNL